MSVTFAKTLQLVFYSQETGMGGEMDMPEATFTSWEGKPWTTQAVKDSSPNHPTFRVETFDQSNMMQVSYPILRRNEVDAPNWAGFVPERQLPAVHESESEVNLLENVKDSMILRLQHLLQIPLCHLTCRQ